MAKWGRQRQRDLDNGADPLPDIPGRESLFKRVKDHEQMMGGAFSVMWISDKDVGKACRDLYASIPKRRDCSEPSFHTDIATALRRGGIRIGKTTIKVRP